MVMQLSLRIKLYEYLWSILWVVEFIEIPYLRKINRNLFKRLGKYCSYEVISIFLSNLPVLCYLYMWLCFVSNDLFVTLIVILQCYIQLWLLSLVKISSIALEVGCFSFRIKSNYRKHLYYTKATWIVKHQLSLKIESRLTCLR